MAGLAFAIMPLVLLCSVLPQGTQRKLPDESIAEYDEIEEESVREPSEASTEELRKNLSSLLNLDPNIHIQGGEIPSFNLSLGAITLLDVQEAALTFNYEARAVLRYRHPLIRWAPSDYDGRIELKVEKMWAPRITPCLARSTSSIEAEISEYTIDYTGYVSQNVNIQVAGKCTTMSFLMFPFDFNKCLLCFRYTNWARYPSHFDVEIDKDIGFVSNSQFTLNHNVTKKSIDMTQGKARMKQIVIEVTFSRFPDFHVKSIILPMTVSAALILTFQAMAKDKIAVFLAAMAFFGSYFTYFLSTSLPKQEFMPALGWYLVVLFLHIAASASAQILVCLILENEKKKVEEDDEVDEEQEAQEEQPRQLQLLIPEEEVRVGAAAAIGEHFVWRGLKGTRAFRAVALLWKASVAPCMGAVGRFLRSVGRYLWRYRRTTASVVIWALSIIALPLLYAFAFWITYEPKK